MSIAENLQKVQANIAAAAEKSGRSAGDITLVGATKMNDAARIQEAISAGLRFCGENRVQELTEKLPLGAYEGAELHFIGHLQKNKAKQVVGKASLIQSVDSLELLSLIDKLAGDRGITQNVLLEVNVAGEEAKSGFRPEDIGSAIVEAANFKSILVRGLMAVPPICRHGEENIPYFRIMEQLFIDNSRKKYDNIVMDFLSMGMSGDYETAIACGANMVRIGSAIFGERIYVK
jgi:hypothetical protein